MTPQTLRFPEMHCGRYVAISMLLVVMSLFATLAVLQWRLLPIEMLAFDIARDAAPSGERLVTMRTELLRLSTAVDDYLSRTDNGGTIFREDIGAARRRLDAELNAYRSLPNSPQEIERLETVDEDLELLDEAIAAALAKADAASSAMPYSSFHRHLQTVDEDLVGLERLNLAVARESSQRIREARRDALGLGTLFGLVSLAVAALTGIWLLGLMRGRARAMRKHGRMLTERASELEAFAGRVAHDLKNPLGAMATLVLLAKRRSGDIPQLSNDLDRLTRQVKQMDQIIEGMLAFARSGANPPPGARADLKAILDEVISDLRPAAKARDVELRIESFTTTELECTPAALMSILTNLLGNAVKYIEGGSQQPRRVAIRVKSQDAFTRVEVEDTGPGLPPGAEAIVFEPFRRLAKGNQPGTGLGLATVKKLVEAYGGKLGVISAEGQGSIFWFEVPNAPVGGLPQPLASDLRHVGLPPEAA